MAQVQKYLQAFGIFSAGSLITYATINRENLQSFQKSYEKNDTSSILTDSVEKISTEYADKHDKIIKKCRSKLEQLKTKECIPGMVVGVSVKGVPVWKCAYGFADIENNVKCSEETVMRIASISKSVTSTFLMKMVEKNKLDLDKPIRTYLTKEQFPDKYWEGKPVEITLRQLAAHLGGIRHYKKVDEDTDPESVEFLINKRYKTAIESLNIFKEDPLISEPGKKYNYTTFGWTLISAVIESQLEKTSFGDAFQKFIRVELGLRNTKLDENATIIPYRSKYYYLEKYKLKNCPSVDNSSKWAGGGLVSNINDLLQFGNLMLYSSVSGKLPGFFTKKQIDEMWSPLPVTIENGNLFGYGIGWVSVKNGSAKIAFGPEASFDNYAFHTGAAVGASSVLLIEPKNEIVVSIITNLQNVNGLVDSALELAKEFSKS